MRDDIPVQVKVESAVYCEDALISLAAAYAPEDQMVVDVLTEAFLEFERAEEHFAKAKDLLREGGARLLERLDASCRAVRVAPTQSAGDE